MPLSCIVTQQTFRRGLYTAKVTSQRTRPSSSLIIPLLLVFFPALAFTGTIALKAIDFPLRDDYDTILDFANGLVGRSTFAGRLALLLAAQSNEYKLYVLHAAVWLQLAVLHHIDFRILIHLGDAFVLLLGILLWKHFLPACSDLRRRLFYFVPVSCLLFELRYQEAADWSTATLQHMPCLLFSFAAIYLLSSQPRLKFCMALACFALAICSSGNGFLLMPVGLLWLLVERKYVRAMAWLAMFAGCAAIYFQHYTRVNMQAQQGLSTSLFHIHPTYFFMFLGSIAARPSLTAGVVLGILICAFLAYLAITGRGGLQTSTTYCMLYLLLTAAAVAALRGNVDPMQISTSRYTIYSALVLIFSWILFLERRGRADATQLISAPVLNIVVAVTFIFAISTYLSGFHAIQRTNVGLRTGMASYEHPPAGDESLGPIVPLNTDDEEQKVFRVRARQELTRSIQLGTYTPPPL